MGARVERKTRSYMAAGDRRIADVVARSTFTARQLIALLTPPDSNAEIVASAPTEPVRAVLPTGLKVLVAEDNPVNQLVTRGLLGKLGIEADVVEHGRAAVERYRDRLGDYDIVLMDLDMPVLDGNAATREIRNLEATMGWRRCPILALSAHALPEYGAMARAAAPILPACEVLTMTIRMRSSMAVPCGPGWQKGRAV